MANLIRTTRTYASYENAEAALTKVAGPEALTTLRYLIAATPDGRFAPVLLLSQPTLGQSDVIGYAHRGITVVG